ncbi:MAG TPA: 5'-3' exonuclease H3TH domain-containing protein [Chthoniobacteraceae bacterium]|jgi:DNA polymerase-1|nr:5'-3' exonuclease H3TH domain-containing protein [Chthoniobacteraceae bacterium]
MKLLLVDGHYYVYRSFFAIQKLSNSKGEPTNAIYGFIKTLRRMMKDLSPDLAAVVWDRGLPKRRTEMQPAYKQQRVEMPDLLVPQCDCIQDEVVPFLGFPGVSLEDTEADDLMASYACAARRLGHEVVLATNDKDLFQLVDDRVRVYTTNKTDLATPKDTHALLGAASVRTKWGVAPEQIGDVLALIGDSVDNIPGVPGLGPKNAAALVQEFGSTEQLLAGLDSVKKDGLREKLKAAREQIVQNREMVRLDLDLPLPVPLEELLVRPRYADLITVLERCEFKGLLEEIRLEAGKAAPVAVPMAPAAPIVRLTQGDLFG